MLKAFNLANGWVRTQGCVHISLRVHNLHYGVIILCTKLSSHTKSRLRLSPCLPDSLIDKIFEGLW